MELIWVTPGCLGSPVTLSYVGVISINTQHLQQITNPLMFGMSNKIELTSKIKSKIRFADLV